MGVPAAREVVLIPFPFSDLSQTKVRPAVCLADAGRGDWILCQITSSPYGDAGAESLAAGDFVSGGLLTHSFARPAKLFTLHQSTVIRTLGILSEAAFKRVLNKTIDVLRT